MRCASYCRPLTQRPAWPSYAQHNLQPRTVYTWKEKFLDAGKSSFDGSNMSLLSKRYKKEISSLKRIIGEYAVANDALKKRWRETKNECSISHAGYRRTQQVPAALWSIKKGHGAIAPVISLCTKNSHKFRS